MTPTAARSRPADRSLRHHLAALALALALPVVVFVGVLLWRFADLERDRLEGQTLATARAVSVAIDRELAGLVSTVEVVSLFGPLKAGDLQAFHSQATAVRERTGTEIVLRDLAGQQLVNTRVPWGEALPRSPFPDVDAEVRRTKRPAVSGLFQGAIARAPLFTVVAPVPRGGEHAGGDEAAYLLSLSLPVERVRRTLLEELASSGAARGNWTVAVVDGAGLILARNRSHEEFVGRPATRDLQDATRDGKEGTWRGTTADGKEIFGAFARSRASGWRVAVGIPESALAAPIYRSLVLLGALGAGLGGLAALLALLVGRRIEGPMRALADRAAALGRGDPVAPLATPVREVNGVAGELGAASAALRDREAALRGSEARLRAILDTVPVGVVIAEAPSGRIVDGNKQADRVFGHPVLPSPDAESYREWISHHPDGRRVEAAEYPLSRVVRDGAEQAELEVLYRRGDGREAWLRLVAAPVREAGGTVGGVVAALDIDREKRAEAGLRELNASLERRIAEAIAEREQAEERLRQAQKMEAVGQLTGGVAHDFNNLLQVVMGSLDLLRRRMADGDARVRLYIDSAAEAAQRGAVLTARLLAFSRRQTLEPKPVDLNKLVTGMSDLLRRSLGEAVRIETVLGGGLWRACADQNQLENAILNLAVNARDAMPEGGRLTIETSNAHLDERYAMEHGDIPPGQYALVAVSDTGSGMAPEVAARAFEPFFTTKDVGQGTGLGLSQVYGFVKQSGGHVKIYSEPGEGTSVKIYLPRLRDEEAAADACALPEEDRPPALAPSPAMLPGAGETVLVVEDQENVRRFTTDALRELGYRVLEADGARAALRLLDAHPEVALLFTDVIMPEVNGRKLADEALRRRPDLKVLFTTGYSRNAIIHNGVLKPGVQLIGKPFTLGDLAAKLRAVLGR